MKALVKVTKEVLLESKDCCRDIGINCAVSKAVIQLLPNSWVEEDQILVYANYLDLVAARFGKNKQIQPVATIILPYEAQLFIREFDETSADGRPYMEPISFEIDIPEEVIQLIGIGQVYKVLSESRTLEMIMEPETV